jgi:hypothetical protein
MTPTGSEHNSATGCFVNHLGKLQSSSAAESDAFSADFISDARLATLVRLWPTLSESVKDALHRSAQEAAGRATVTGVITQ